VRNVYDDERAKTLPAPEPNAPAWVLRFSADGRFLAAKHHLEGEEEKHYHFRVWDLDRGKQLTISSFAVCERAFAFSPDSHTLAVGGEEGGIRLYNLSDADPDKAATLVQTILAKDSRPTCLAFNRSGQQLAAANTRAEAGQAPLYEVQIYDVDSGQPRGTPLPHPAWNSGLAWHPDGKRLAVACNDHKLYLWNVDTGGEHLVLRGHEAEVQEVVFSHDGNLLVSTSYVETCLWDPRTGKQLLRGPVLPNPQLDPTGRVLGVGGTKAALWEVSAAQECRVLHGHTVKGPWSVEFSRDGGLMVSASNDGVRIWDTATAREVGSVLDRNARSALIFDSETGRQLLAAHGTGLDRWPIAREAEGAGGELGVGPAQELIVQPKEGLENRAALAVDVPILALSDYDRGLAHTVDMRTLKSVPLPGEHKAIAEIAISPDGRWVAGSSRQRGLGIRVWDRVAGATAWNEPTLSGALTFSPEGEWLVVASPRGYSFIRVGSWARGRVIQPVGELVPRAAFSRDGKLLAVSPNGRSIRLVDAATGDEFATLTAPDPGILTWLCFSPDGHQLAAAAENFTIQLWDLKLIRRQLADLNLDW
jgi:WD40 repeat protein